MVTLKNIFQPTKKSLAILSKIFKRPPFSMNFMLEVPADLATTIYEEGAKFNLNKTASLHAVFIAGAMQFEAALHPSKKKTTSKSTPEEEPQNGTKGKSEESGTQEPTES